MEASALGGGVADRAQCLLAVRLAQLRDLALRRLALLPLELDAHAELVRPASQTLLELVVFRRRREESVRRARRRRQRALELRLRRGAVRAFAGEGAGRLRAHRA